MSGYLHFDLKEITKSDKNDISKKHQLGQVGNPNYVVNKLSQQRHMVDFVTAHISDDCFRDAE